MRLNRWSYRADYAVLPLLASAVALVSLRHASTWQIEEWLASALAGGVGWTLLEYGLHRWLLHRVQPFQRLHEAHHARPYELIGTPAWLSAPLFAMTWLALEHGLPRSAAGGAAVGLMLGYLAYTLLHDAVHHLRASPGSLLAGAKRRHARHHRPGASSDFGVTTGVWDRVFGTSAEPRQPGGDDGHAESMTRR